MDPIIEILKCPWHIDGEGKKRLLQPSTDHLTPEEAAAQVIEFECNHLSCLFGGRINGKEGTSVTGDFETNTPPCLRHSREP